ncbi:acyltransferase [Herbaspirillum sp. LeCh32-8]|uniref:acyltransferase family protein n=1 Tax=Herbaspirillum sp. LeCh32-8 TaxID=2821356 RepID=UPI001AE674CD|nr:acyltransferase [Herbaspirillum sp. LeCh32-8]MBP0597945.1 acyltransferase [Herbaspirillum sp. LeCh32-8]
MGILRFLLALSVIVMHAGPVFGLNFSTGVQAVEAFFMISGFYVALILREKYVGSGYYWRFIGNRALKIFPMYWAVLGLLVIYCSRAYLRSGNFGPMNIYLEFPEVISAKFLVLSALSNILIFGQDVAMFLGFNEASNGLEFTANFAASSPPVFRFLLIPQAWTLALELMFYLIAPFLVNRSNLLLLAIVALGACLRFWFAQHNYFNSDQWLYRFFPLELPFFLVGILLYRIYSKLKSIEIHRVLLLCTGMMGLVAAALQIPLEMNKWIFYLIVAIAIPCLFILSKKSALDRWIGDLSYPIYISHLFVMWVLSASDMFQKTGIDRGTLTAICTVCFAVALVHLFRPIESFRQRRAVRV